MTTQSNTHLIGYYPFRRRTRFQVALSACRSAALRIALPRDNINVTESRMAQSLKLKSRVSSFNAQSKICQPMIRAVKNSISWARVRLAANCLLVVVVPYLLTYFLLVGAGERRAKARSENEYFLVYLDGNEGKAEYSMCLFFWPIYSIDSVYADDKLRPWNMPRKEMGLEEYTRLWRINVFGH